MKKVLIKSAKLIDSASPLNNKEVNVLIEGGKIAMIDDATPEADEVIDAKGMILSMGWFDMRASFGDPGYEHKEDLESGVETAAAGGFTGIALLPNNNPVTQTKNDVKYLRSNNADFLTDLFPIAAVTLNTKGEDLTEMIDLHEAGAVAFSDGHEPIWQADIVLKSLQYLQKFNGLLINLPEDNRLNLFGTMNEGINSTKLGMKGMPKLSEELIVQRDLELLDYAGGKLHLTSISSARSVEMIKKAKERGLNVTCDIAAYQTAFDDSALHTFDSNFKVYPPFREKEDNQALIDGLKSGVIDVIVSNHVPQDEESKKLEFDLAEFGAISLQTVAHDIARLSRDVDMDILINAITTKPRELLNLELPKLSEGAEANLTLFDPAHKWEVNAKSNKSKSKNSPYWGQQIEGKVVAVFNKGKQYIDDAVKR